ncbi:MAG: hypothetical protein Q9169_008510, partial [Polycauliona sp. 2 TL-2023]
MGMLTHLTLPYCQANEVALESLLRGVNPPLTHLTYEYHTPTHNDYEWRPMNLITLSIALSPIQYTLEHLTLGFEEYPSADDGLDPDQFPGYEEGPFVGNFKSLSEYPRLRYLKIPFVMLTGWTVVSPTVRSLTDILPGSLEQFIQTDRLMDWTGCAWRIHHWLEHLGDLLAAQQISTSSRATQFLRRFEMLRTLEHRGWGSAQESVLRRR